MENMAPYFRGEALYGDDFSASQIAEWYLDEKEGYAELGAKDITAYRYAYHAWNRFHAFEHLPDTPFEHVLGFGSAYGDELLPIIPRTKHITIVDPSGFFACDSVHGVPTKYVKPAPSGQLLFSNDTFDLITCLGVLHHIPNVSFVVSELARVLKPNHYMILREPIVSMGDWRKPRRGLTKRERGIPLDILENIVKTSGLDIIRRSLCAFPLTPHLFRLIRSDAYNSRVATWIDANLSMLFSWNVTYHARNVIQRLRPTSAFLVVRKTATHISNLVEASKRRPC